MVDRHKVFISYYHDDDQIYKDELTRMKFYDGSSYSMKSVFDDYSVRDGDIDDSLSDEQIRVKIRDDFIRNATVLILLCGPNTRKRKHVDWEIHAAMFDTELNPKMGILVINMPEISQCVRASEEDEKPLISSSSNWVEFESREEYEKYYPYMPSRIIDNFVIDAPISVVNWERIKNNPNLLMKLIDNAFKRKDSINYDHSTPLRRNNS